MNDTINQVGAGAPAAPVAQAEQEPVAQKILDLILAECKYWHYRDEARRGGFAALYAKAKEVADAAPPAHPDAALVEALQRVKLSEEEARHHSFAAVTYWNNAVLACIAALAGKGGE